MLPIDSNANANTSTNADLQNFQNLPDAVVAPVTGPDSPRTIANRLNAKKSTGPRTAAGKRIVSGNATVHGFTGQRVVFSEGEYIHYLRIAEGMMADLLPVGMLEQQLAQKIVDANFQWNQAQAMEFNLIAVGTAEWYEAEPGADVRTDAISAAVTGYRRDCSGPNALDKMSRHAARLHREYFKCLDEFDKRQARRLKRDPDSAVTRETCVNRQTYALMIESYEADLAAAEAIKQAAKQAAPPPAAQQAEAEAAAETALETKASQLIQNADTSELALFCGELAGMLGIPTRGLPKLPPKRTEKEAA